MNFNETKSGYDYYELIIHTESSHHILKQVLESFTINVYINFKIMIIS
jgi:hypothetical protein